MTSIQNFVKTDQNTTKFSIRVFRRNSNKNMAKNDDEGLASGPFY